jgi:hypothetical protein
MIRSLLVLAALFVVSVGCSPEASKDMAKKATGGMAEAATDAAGDVGGGMSDMMGKATEALSGVEGGSDMLKQVTEMFGTATKTLTGVKDTDSATAALPELGKLTEGFGGMTEMFGKMPDAAKGAVSSVFQSSLGQLKPIIENVMSIPGVEAILRPAIDALMSKLDAFK